MYNIMVREYPKPEEADCRHRVYIYTGRSSSSYNSEPVSHSWRNAFIRLALGQATCEHRS